MRPRSKIANGIFFVMKTQISTIFNVTTANENINQYMVVIKRFIQQVP